MKELLELLETRRRSQRRLSARDFLSLIVRDREAHWVALNQYRFGEECSCKDLADLIEQLDGQPPELVKDLSHHIAEEARHAAWLTELLVDLGASVKNPPRLSYLREFKHLLDQQANNPGRHEDFVIASLTAINRSEKRGCENFAAHIYVLKQQLQTEEIIKIRETIERIFAEEVEHIHWGNRWLASIAAQSPEHRHKVEVAKLRYTLIEQAAYAAIVDLTLGAEARRVRDLFHIASTMPLWQGIQYFTTRLPRTLLAPDLQLTRFYYLRQVWQQDSRAFFKLLWGAL
ncbi:MAG: ferritin-like domain-containing protein [Cyanobacteria bacterium CRU_2_1]|nr:ferritin-like domain-containing protein [Cyanobacteria bacterium CRU_2_1]